MRMETCDERAAEVARSSVHDWWHRFCSFTPEEHHYYFYISMAATRQSSKNSAELMDARDFFCRKLDF